MNKTSKTSDKNKDQSLVNHEILNILTTLRFLIEEQETMDPKVKKKCFDDMAWVSVLVGQSELFQGKTPRVLLSPTLLEEILEIAILVQEESEQKKIKWNFPEKEQWVLTDKNRSKDILTALIRFVLEQSHSIEIEVQKNKLMLHHQGGVLALPDKKPLDCLEGFKMEPFKQLLCVLLFQAPSIQMKMVNKKNLIEIYFKSP